MEGKERRLKADIWMPLYIGDYLKDTQHLVAETHGAYLLLVMHYWTKRGPLPDDDRYLANVARLSESQWQTHRQTLCEFFAIANGKWTHARIDEEIALATANKEKRSKSGKTGATARWNGKRNGDRIANALPTQWQNDGPSPSPSPNIIHTEGPAVELPPGFPKDEAEALSKSPLAFQERREFVIDTWHKANGRGGRDSRDIPIRNWASHLAIEWKWSQNRAAEQQAQPAARPGATGNANAPVWAKIKAVEAQVAAVKAQLRKIPAPARDVFPEQYDEAMKKRAPLIDELARLEAQLKELNRQQTL